MWFATPLKVFRQPQRPALQDHTQPQDPQQSPSRQEPHPPSRQEPQQSRSQTLPEENVLLSHHPNINFLSSATPIPSFPKTVTLNSLKLAQRQSEINFISEFIKPNPSPSPNKSALHQENHPPEQPNDQQAISSTLRLIDELSADQSSTFNLPYPNPDLSTITTHNTLIDSDMQPKPTPARRISALPSRAQTPFKLFKPQPSSPSTRPDHQQLKHHQLQSPINRQDRSPLSTKSINPSSPTRQATAPNNGNNSLPPKELTSPTSQKIISPSRPNFPTPSAALSDIFKPQDPPALPNSTSIDQVMAELENRTQAGPRITKITFQDQQNAQATQPPADRFTDAHGKQFARYDSIANHYAAKRKNDATSMNGRSVTNPSKRAKVSDFGYPKRLVSQQEMDAEQAQKKEELVKRQLELARSRRRTAGGASALGSRPGSSKPTPSGFSLLGTRILKTAVKTVAGAFKASQKPSTKVGGVGFGAPAGLGVGPAKVPAPVPAPAKRTVGRPTRMVNKPPLSRLPPAGHHRLLSTTTPALDSLSEAARRRVVSVPPTASSNPLGASKMPPRGAITRAQASGPTKPASVSNSTWQPKTLPKPAKPMSSRINPPRSRQATQTISTDQNANPGPSAMGTRSRIPKISSHSHGHTVIRPSVKSGDEPSRRVMMTSTSTATSMSSTRSVVRIGLSAKTVPKKLSQPIQSTKPIATQTRLATAALRRTTTTAPGAGSSLARKSSSHPSRVMPHKDRGLPACDLPKRKLIFKNRRRSSAKHVGIRAVSHRVSSS